jgi:hypothetical protein
MTDATNMVLVKIPHLRRSRAHLLCHTLMSGVMMSLTMSWVTYTELARSRGIDARSAMKLVQRRKWQRRPVGDESGRVQVLVPSACLATRLPI